VEKMFSKDLRPEGPKLNTAMEEMPYLPRSWAIGCLWTYRLAAVVIQ
jgi:hypothetical protein